MLQFVCTVSACILAFACGCILSKNPALFQENHPAPAGIKQAKDWRLIPVNGSHPLPRDFTADCTRLRSGQSIDSRAYEDLQAMMDAARAKVFSPTYTPSKKTI